MIDLNNWYKQYQKNPDRIQFEMAQSAARELFDAVQTNYYGFDDLKNLNYSEVCEWLGWLIEYEQQLREAGYDEKTIAHLVLEAVK